MINFGKYFKNVIEKLLNVLNTNYGSKWPKIWRLRFFTGKIDRWPYQRRQMSRSDKFVNRVEKPFLKKGNVSKNFKIDIVL